MALQTIPFDAANYLNDAEDVAAYLKVALAEGDEAAFREALGTAARSVGMSELARRAGLGRESLYKALGASGNPAFATVVKVLDALGVSLTIDAKRVARRALAPKAPAERAFQVRAATGGALSRKPRDGAFLTLKASKVLSSPPAGKKTAKRR